MEKENMEVEANREALVEHLMRGKHPDDPMTRADARMVVDLAAAIGEEAQRIIMRKIDLLPQPLKLVGTYVALRSLEVFAVDTANMMAEKAMNMVANKCDCIVCRQEEIIKEMTKVAEGDGFVAYELKPGKPH